MRRLPPCYSYRHPSPPVPLHLPSESPNERSRKEDERGEDEVESLTFPERCRDEEEDDSNEGVDGVGGDGDSSRVEAGEPVVAGEEDGRVEEEVGELSKEESDDGSRIGLVPVSEDGVCGKERKKTS